MLKKERRNNAYVAKNDETGEKAKLYQKNHGHMNISFP